MYCNYVLQICFATMYCNYVLQLCIATMYMKYVFSRVNIAPKYPDPPKTMQKTVL